MRNKTTGLSRLLSPSASQLANVTVAWKRFSRSTSGLVGLSIVIMLVVAAILANVLATHDPNAVSRNRLEPPSQDYPFGTDNVGKDVFSGVLYGARVSLAVGVLAALTSMIVGVVIGSFAGYYGGVIDSLLMRFSELLQTMPRFFLALVVVAIFGGGTGMIIAVIGLLQWPSTARIARAQFLSLREQEFVEAAKVLGCRDGYIIFFEILPNSLAPVIVQVSLDIGAAILLEAGLSFFGLGDPRIASWGQMLNRAQAFLRTAWWMSVFPGMAVFFAVLGFNLVGDALNDALNPQLKEM